MNPGVMQASSCYHSQLSITSLCQKMLLPVNLASHSFARLTIKVQLWGVWKLTVPVESMHKHLQIAVDIKKLQFVLAQASWKPGVKRTNLCNQELVCLVFTKVNFQVSAKTKQNNMHACSKLNLPSEHRQKYMQLLKLLLNRQHRVIFPAVWPLQVLKI